MLPGYKEIVELIKKGATVEAQEKIMELREAVIEFQEDNSKLKSRINELEEELKIRGNLEYSKSVYWLWNEDEAGDNTIKDGPYCQRCYDAEQKLIRLQDWGDDWSCFNCKLTYVKQM